MKITKKEVLKKLIKDDEEQIISDMIAVQYLTRQLIVKEVKVDELALGKLQGKIKTNKNYLKFLEEQLKEEDKRSGSITPHQ